MAARVPSVDSSYHSSESGAAHARSKMDCTPDWSREAGKTNGAAGGGSTTTNLSSGNVPIIRQSHFPSGPGQTTFAPQTPMGYAQHNWMSPAMLPYQAGLTTP